MVIWVINSESKGRWNTHTDVTEDGKGLVYKNVRMTGPVGKVMDKDVAGVSDGPAEDIYYWKNDWPRGILKVNEWITFTK
jgi:hypothetical protein